MNIFNNMLSQPAPVPSPTPNEAVPESVTDVVPEPVIEPPAEAEMSPVETADSKVEVSSGSKRLDALSIRLSEEIGAFCQEPWKAHSPEGKVFEILGGFKVRVDRKVGLLLSVPGATRGSAVGWVLFSSIQRGKSPLVLQQLIHLANVVREIAEIARFALLEKQANAALKGISAARASFNVGD